MKHRLFSLLLSAIAATAAPATASAATPQVVTDAVRAIDEVCVPVLSGAQVQSRARAAGFTDRDGQWAIAEEGGGQIVLRPPDASNPHVCGANVTAPAADAAALRQAVGRWAQAQSPPFRMTSPGAPGGGSAAHWSSAVWVAKTPSGALSLALGQEQATTEDQAVQSNLVLSLSPS